MAINSQKLLSGSSFTTKEKKVSITNQSSKENRGSIVLSKNLISIKTRLIKIDKLLNENLTVQKNLEKYKKIQNEKIKFRKKEEKLEEKKEKQTLKSNFSTPQLGIFDRINRFITFTFIGFIVNKLFKYYPKIIEFTKKIKPVVNFLEFFVGNIFKGFVNFIDFGYKTYDQVRSLSKQVPGENFQKTFDEFSSKLNTFINLAIIAGMSTMGGSSLRSNKNLNVKNIPSKKGSSILNSRLDDYNQRNKQTKFIEKRYGNDAARMYEARRAQGVSQQRALSDVRNRFTPLKERFGAQRGLGGGTGKGAIFSRGLGRSANRGILKILGKTGTRIAKGIFGRVPIIGGLLDFAFSLAMGEPKGRAAAKAVGATIGAALGTFIPIPFAGTILGGILGDIVGGALYDTLTSMSKKSKKSIQGRSNGGQLSTRGGRVVGGKIKRINKIYKKPPESRIIEKGSFVGGEEKLKKIFPEPTPKQIGTSVNPFGFVSNTSEKFGSIPFIGPIFNIFGKVLLGDLPTKDDYRIAGLGLNIWINNAISKGILRGNGSLIGGFADGGMIDIQNEMTVNINKWAEKSIEELVKNKVTDAINDLQKNLGLKTFQQNINQPTLPPEELGDATDSVGGARLLMAAGFPMLAAAILAGNIQAESGWRGQRTPWVLNDGAGTNKGLISWNRTRITNAERFLGKPLETASNAEQVKWIKEELKQYGLLDEFMDPNRTEEQLKSDSYKYIGWGKEGDRWAYSKQIFSALQRGEQGTYRPGSTGPGTLGSNSGNLNIAKQLAESMGLQMTSFVRPGDPGYHGKGRAMDFQTIGAPGNSGTPSQLQFAKTMIERYGSKMKQLIYTPLGFGIADGKVVGLDYWGDDTNSIHYDHVHVAFKGGGVITKDKKTRNTSFLNSRAYYDDDYDSSTVYIQPIIETVYVPLPMNNVSSSFNNIIDSNSGNLLRS